MKAFQQCAWAFLAAAVFVCGASAEGSVIVSDTFAHNDTTGTTLVTGTSTEVAAKTWSTTYQTIAAITTTSGGSFDAGSGAAYFATGASFGTGGDYVTFSPVTADTITVQAEVLVSPGGDVASLTDFITLGLNANGTIGYSNPGPWVSLTAAGTASVFDGDVTAMHHRSVSSSTGFTFNPTGYNLLALTYDFVSEIATVSVNGTAATSLDFNVGTGNPAPTSIMRAGFFAYNEPSTARVDAFVVSVPEPASMSLLALGGLLLIRRRQR